MKTPANNLLQHCLLLACLTCTPTFAETGQILPDEPAIPEWLLKKTLDPEKMGVRDLELTDNSIFFVNAPDESISITGTNMGNGQIVSNWPDDTTQPGIYIGLGSSKLNTGMHFITCRVCKIRDPDTQETLEFDGLIFEKPDFSFADLINIPNQENEQPQDYVFADEAKLTVEPLPTGVIDYSDLRYLSSIGYEDYLYIPVRTRLREKAQAGDAKAQFIYALYWRESYTFDESGSGLAHMKTTLQIAAPHNPDAALWLGMLHKQDKQAAAAVPLLEQALASDNPLAAYKLGLIMINGENGEIDAPRACELFEKAALAGLDAAQYDYGFCLYHGEGGTHDIKKGQHYMALAAANQASNAVEALGRCNGPLPRVERDKLVYNPCDNKPI